MLLAAGNRTGSRILDHGHEYFVVEWGSLIAWTGFLVGIIQSNLIGKVHVVLSLALWLSKVSIEFALTSVILF